MPSKKKSSPAQQVNTRTLTQTVNAGIQTDPVRILPLHVELPAHLLKEAELCYERNPKLLSSPTSTAAETPDRVTNSEDSPSLNQMPSLETVTSLEGPLGQTLSFNAKKKLAKRRAEQKRKEAEKLLVVEEELKETIEVKKKSTKKQGGGPRRTIEDYKKGFKGDTKGQDNNTSPGHVTVLPDGAVEGNQLENDDSITIQQKLDKEEQESTEGGATITTEVSAEGDPKTTSLTASEMRAMIQNREQELWMNQMHSILGGMGRPPQTGPGASVDKGSAKFEKKTTKKQEQKAMKKINKGGITQSMGAPGATIEEGESEEKVVIEEVGEA